MSDQRRFLDEDPGAVITACGHLESGKQCGERLMRCDQPADATQYQAECPVHGIHGVWERYRGEPAPWRAIA